jgi:hypothetical protein
MSPETPRETTELHTRLLKCALLPDESRAWWRHRAPSEARPDALHIFEAGWFGARSLPRIRVLRTNLHARFDAFPPALSVLHRWQGMPPDTRRLICHWHVQLSDPLYRRFSSEYLVQRRQSQPTVTREHVVRWVGEQGHARWTMPTRIQFASKLLSCAHGAGLIGKGRTVRPITLPRVSDEALGYLLQLLRGVHLEDGLLDNAYLRTLGLSGPILHDRLCALPGLDFEHQAGLVDLRWHQPDLTTWAAAHLPLREAP